MNAQPLSQPLSQPLCLFSQSATFAADIRRDCPLRLTMAESRECPHKQSGRRDSSNGNGRTVAITACTHQNDEGESTVSAPPAPSPASSPATAAPSPATAASTPPPQQSAKRQSRFRPGSRHQLKLRMAIDGPSGAGKTYTGLRCAFALARASGKPNPTIAVIGTEGSPEDDSAEKYIGEPDPDMPGQTWQFDVLHLTSFSPSEYASAIEDAGRAGYDVLLIDSLSHAWEGKDGALELKDKKGGNSYAAWKDITPMHRRMVEAILSAPLHLVATMRSKTEHVLELDEKGKQVPRKVGMAPIQRAGMEYEFDVYGSLDWSHILTVTKSRCRAVDGLIVAKPGAAFMQPIIDWLGSGVQVERAAPKARIGDDQLARIAKQLDALGWKVDRIKPDLPKKYGCTELDQLSVEQGKALIAWLEGHVNAAARDAAREAATAKLAGTAPAQAQVTPAPAQAVATPAPPPAPTPVNTAAATPARLSDSQKAELIGLRKELNGLQVEGGVMDVDTWAKLLSGRYRLTTAMDLTTDQADDFITYLRQWSLSSHLGGAGTNNGTSNGNGNGHNGNGKPASASAETKGGEAAAAPAAAAVKS